MRAHQPFFDFLPDLDPELDPLELPELPLLPDPPPERLESVLPTELNWFAMRLLTEPMAATQPSAIKEQIKAYSIKSWPESPRSRLISNSQAVLIWFLSFFEDWAFVRPVLWVPVAVQFGSIVVRLHPASGGLPGNTFVFRWLYSGRNETRWVTRAGKI